MRTLTVLLINDEAAYLVDISLVDGVPTWSLAQWGKLNSTADLKAEYKTTWGENPERNFCGGMARPVMKTEAALLLNMTLLEAALDKLHEILLGELELCC